jgi:hypothetical protein
LKTNPLNSIPINWRYRFGCQIKTATTSTILLLALVLSVSVSLASEFDARHRLQVEIFPQEQKLRAIDEISIEKSPGDGLDFKLSHRAQQIEVTVNDTPREIDFKNGRLHVRLAADEKDKEIRIAIRYAAIFDDPVPVRPVNADNPGFGVGATISDVGSFLLAGSGWYPQWAAGHSIYTLKVIAPEGMIAVTAGELKGHVTQNGKTESTWLVNDPVRGLSLSVGAYIVREKRVGKITAATYFFQETDHLLYLDRRHRFAAALYYPYQFRA